MEGGGGLAQGVRAGLTAAQRGRRFGITVGTAFLVLAGLILWRGREQAAFVTGGLGVMLWLGALVAPAALVPVERAWMALAHALSRITTPLFMGIVYFVVVAPIGVVMRAFGRHPLRHRGEDGGFWIRRSAVESDLRRQF